LVFSFIYGTVQIGSSFLQTREKKLKYQRRKRWHQHVPNALSWSRIVLGLLLPIWWFLGVEVVSACVAWALVSDGFDGWTARVLNARSPIGVVLDPIADKLFAFPFLLAAAFTYGGADLWLLFVVNSLYDIDNTYQRRWEIRAAWAGRYARANKPVTGWSKSKTAALFMFMTLVATVPWHDSVYLFWPALICLAMVSYSWWCNRRAWARAQMGLHFRLS